MGTALPSELWEAVFNHFVLLAKTRRELTIALRINKLAYSCIRGRLYETIASRIKELSATITAFQNLPELIQRTCVHRLWIPALSAGGVKLLLEFGAGTINRLRITAASLGNTERHLNQDTIMAIGKLSNLTFLELPVQHFVAIQKHLDLLVWASSLQKLSLLFHQNGPCNGVTYSDAIISIDLAHGFPNLTYLSLDGFARDIDRCFPHLLPRCPTVRLIVISDPWAELSITGGPKLLVSNVIQPVEDRRVVYYMSYGEEFEEKIVESYSTLRERPSKELSDRPFDDWDEITSYRELHVWNWAEEALSDGRRTFQRPMVD